MLPEQGITKVSAPWLRMWRVLTSGMSCSSAVTLHLEADGRKAFWLQDCICMKGPLLLSLACFDKSIFFSGTIVATVAILIQTSL